MEDEGKKVKGGNTKISYDILAKAVYIELEKKKVAKTKEIAPEVFLHFDYKGEPIGVELLNPGTLCLRKIAKTFHKPELATVHPRVIAEKAYVQADPCRSSSSAFYLEDDNIELQSILI